MAQKQTKLRTIQLEQNRNISLPIGTILAVQDYYDYLDLEYIFGKHKTRGFDINNLLQALLSYKLTENRSISKASDWINRQEVLNIFGLKSFNQRTLYRTLETIGEHHEEIMAEIQDAIFESYNFEHTDINMDWTSLVLYGQKCPLGKFGYSRDHRPDKKQLTVGVSELAFPINVPIGMTVREGNVNDQVHFDDTFDQVCDRLEEDSMVVFDQGANRKVNLDRIDYQNLKYLTARQLNKSDDTWIQDFNEYEPELIDERNGIYGLKREFPSRVNYLYFSEELHKQQIETKFRKVDRLFDEAQAIQNCIEQNKTLPKQYQINNPLVECKYSYQTKLTQMSEAQAKRILKRAAITGREGFFCLVSNRNLTLKEALETYRRKDSIEKLFNSIKNELDLKPLRVWSTNSIYGVMILAFLVQLIISLIRYEHEEICHTSPKFIKLALMNLTVTIEFGPRNQKRMIFSNFNWISRVILARFFTKSTGNR